MVVEQHLEAEGSTQAQNTILVYTKPVNSHDGISSQTYYSWTFSMLLLPLKLRGYYSPISTLQYYQRHLGSSYRLFRLSTSLAGCFFTRHLVKLVAAECKLPKDAQFPPDIGLGNLDWSQ